MAADLKAEALERADQIMEDADRAMGGAHALGRNPLDAGRESIAVAILNARAAEAWHLGQPHRFHTLRKAASEIAGSTGKGDME